MTNLLRATLRPPAVRPVLLATGGTALLCAVVGLSALRADVVVPRPLVIVLPARVEVAPAPVVLPPTPVVVAAPAPPPPAEPATPVPPPQPRALTPTLDALCVLPNDGVLIPTCAWDDGFPAISADGAVIAIKHDPGMGSPAGSGLVIRFLDTKTSELVRDRVIVTPDEVNEMLYSENATPGDAQPDDKQVQRRQRLMSTIMDRVAAAQSTLDAKHFRTLHALGSARSSVDAEPQPAQPGRDPIYAEFVGTTARIIDSKASQVLWRGNFSVAGPARSHDDQSECSGWSPWSITLWWDPRARVVLAEETYRTGGCMCPDVPVHTIRRMP